MLRGQGNPAGFPQQRAQGALPGRSQGRLAARASRRAGMPADSAYALFPGNGGVDALQPLRNREDKAGYFAVGRSVPVGYKNTRSEAVLEFSQLVQRPGLKPGHRVPSGAARRRDVEGQQGSIAKRWLRRTQVLAEGRIESRGVTPVFPVGGEPGARASDRASRTARLRRGQVGEGLTRATGRGEWE
jgi:hypothetical protein